ncbi:hypothetical protein [Microbacterium sp. LWS13-1.2]|uniref:hypothetical protein n=1 Tax=Microbacterium sp. LWS13-1.2 TaxID=3135264 RepID=UPI0032DA800F
MKKQQGRVSAEAELPDDTFMKAAVSSAGGDQRIGERLHHAAGIDATFDVRLHVEELHMTAGEDPRIL